MTNRGTLQGVFALLFTSFASDGKAIDLQSMHRQFDFIIKCGIASVVAGGKAGEFEGMSLG